MAFLRGGARFLQLRAKQLPSGEFLELCDAVIGLARPLGATVIVNDRVDLALVAGAGGAHVGQDDLSVAATRALLGPDAIVGFSTHTVDQIDAALRLPISYLAVGPVFATLSKDTGYTAVGLDMVREAVRRAQGVPVVAIGGITLATAPDVLAAGATQVAVIGDLLDGEPAENVRRYVKRL